MNTEKELNYSLYIQKEEGFTRTDLKEEFAHYISVKDGDIDAVKASSSHIKKYFFDGKGKLSDNFVKHTRYHVIIGISMVARLCADGGLPHDEAYTLSDIYIQKADKCDDPDKLIDLLLESRLDYTRRMHNLKKANAISLHIRNSIDYIYHHLHEPLTMEELASIAGLHPSYFSKLFVKETGMTTKHYILNAKITTAQNMLIYSEYSISDISLTLGFSSQSAFTTAFKKNTGLTPKEYRQIKKTTNILT